MNPGEKKDIIDEAMVGDDYDYGDTETVETQEGDEGVEPSPKEGVDPKTGDVPQVPDQTQQRLPAGQVADPANPLNLKRVGAQYADGKGNIVDKDGKIIARSGEAARLWQEASRATAQVSNLSRQLDTLTRQRNSEQQLLAQAKEIADLPQKLGISKEDYNEGITLLSNWARDPVGVAREIVARAMALGYNATDILGKNAGDAVEMKALTRLIDQTTAPLRKQQADTAKTAEDDAKSREAYQNFINKYEYSDVHGEAIANLMNHKTNPRTAVDAYYEVRMFALENNLDFTQPLGPQLQARMSGQGGQRNTSLRRVPADLGQGNGRGNEGQLTDKPTMASADDDWGSIIRSVMAEE